MGLRSTSYSNEMTEKDSTAKSTSLVTSLMKSWRISSTSSSSNDSLASTNNNNNNNNSKSILSSESPFYSSPIQNPNSDTRHSIDNYSDNNSNNITRTGGRSRRSSSRKYSSSSQDGNFDAMARQTSSTRKTSTKLNNNNNIINNNNNNNNNNNSNIIDFQSHSNSPLRYVSPSMTNLESPRSSYFRQQHTRNSHHNQYYHNTAGNNNNNNNNNNNISSLNEPSIAAAFSNTNSNNNNNGSTESIGSDNSKSNTNYYNHGHGHGHGHHQKYFQDLDEDWSAVIDDYNAPIPVLLNGGNGNNPHDSLSRTSTNSSITNLNTNTRSSLQYPQLPLIETRSREEIENERQVQELNSMMQRITKFDNILNNKHIINLQELRQISWNGIPKPHRPYVWKLLIGYLPANKNRQETFLKRKRQEYSDGLNHIFSNEHKRDIPTWHQIEIDIPRTNPHIPLYQFKTVHQSLQRILYLWAIRHPASGYVQGINDLVTPFYQTFLTEYLSPSRLDDVENKDPNTYLNDQQLKDVEADTFWCLTKLLEQITDNYIHGQPGILKQVKVLSQLVKRIDSDLWDHFQKEHVEFIQFAFRWMNCLLMREFQMSAVIRMWDTYLSETSIDTSSSVSSSNDLMSPQTPSQRATATFSTPPQLISGAGLSSPHTPSNNNNNSNNNNTSNTNNRFNSVTTLSSLNKDETNTTKVKQSSLNEFHVFVCAAFLIKWSDQLCEMDFQEVITFLQNPPTKDWDEEDIEMLLSGAYIWQSLYKDATSHWL